MSSFWAYAHLCHCDVCTNPQSECYSSPSAQNSSSFSQPSSSACSAGAEQPDLWSKSTLSRGGMSKEIEIHWPYGAYAERDRPPALSVYYHKRAESIARQLGWGPRHLKLDLQDVENGWMEKGEAVWSGVVMLYRRLNSWRSGMVFIRQLVIVLFSITAVALCRLEVVIWI